MKNLTRVLLCMLLLPLFGYANSESEAVSEIECLAQNIYFEARGEAVEGRIAVGYVTLNRVKSKRFPDNVCDVVYQAKYSKWWEEVHQKRVPVRHACQFSWYCDGVADEIEDYPAYEKALMLAQGIMDGQFIDNTMGATHYHAKHVDPWWNMHYNVVADIGNHLFYGKRAR